MTGRGVDQVLPHPGDPRLHERYVASAREYVTLVERASGAWPRPVGFDYVWGDALPLLERMRPDVRIVNLETAVTIADDAWPDKGVHYRMHPANVACLAAARLDCCVLANNHAMDFGRRGLEETLATLHRAGLRTAGAGRNRVEAHAPAIVDVPGKTRVLVFAYGMASSGVPEGWDARASSPGIAVLADLSDASVTAVAQHVGEHRQPRDVVVLSLHWGGNWDYGVAQAQRAFAHRMIDIAGVDVVYGHSSHHPKGIEVYRDRPILHGCGDLIDDYEGIAGHEAYRPELRFLYFVTLDAAGRLVRLVLAPLRVRRMRLERANTTDIDWLAARQDREGHSLGTRVERTSEGMLVVRRQ